jgi:hypothetical protein
MIMKKSYSSLPETFSEQWLKASGGFSWYSHVAGIPSLVFLVTGYKANGKENASLHSWAAFSGSGINDFICLLSKVDANGHLYKSLKETGVCVLNFPSNDLIEKCYETIRHNEYETDEITKAGLTSEKASKINAPCIKECFLNIECELLWEHELCPGSSDKTIALKAVNICMDTDYYDQTKKGRYGDTGYLFLTDAPANPETGDIYSFGLGKIEPGKQGETVNFGPDRIEQKDIVNG